MIGETLGIVLTTYQRTDYAIATVRSVRRHLRFDGDIVWYLADDGSSPEHRAAVWRELEGASILAHHTARIGVGPGMNIGIARVLEVADYYMTLEDDWELRGDFDVTPYVDLLNVHSAVGMVRLGGLPIDLDCRTVGYDGRMYLLVLPSTPYVFSGNPHVRHRRFWDAYGRYPEHLPPEKPGEVEVAFDWHVRQEMSHGPAIIWPMAIGEAPPFGHIGALKTESFA